MVCVAESRVEAVVANPGLAGQTDEMTALESAGVEIKVVRWRLKEGRKKFRNTGSTVQVSTLTKQPPLHSPPHKVRRQCPDETQLLTLLAPTEFTSE